jgi:hypothetical protein
MSLVTDCEPVMQYMSERHEILTDAYVTPDGKINRHLCTHIALDIAELMIDEGMKPRVLQFRARVIDPKTSREKGEFLIPKPYKGKARWSAHQVCCTDGMAFDPMFGEPVPDDEYIKEAFENEDEHVIRRIMFPYSLLERDLDFIRDSLLISE